MMPEYAPECALDEELITRLTLMHRFEEKENVNILVNYTVQRITEDGVAAVTCEDESVMVPADFVIVAFGAVPYNPLEEDARKMFSNVSVIGDAVKPKKIRDAVVDGFFVGYKI